MVCVDDRVSDFHHQPVRLNGAKLVDKEGERTVATALLGFSIALWAIVDFFIMIEHIYIKNGITLRDQRALPGRFPSPTPSVISDPAEILGGVSLFPMTSHVHTRSAGMPLRDFSRNHTAPPFARQRPRFSSAQSERQLLPENRRDSHAQNTSLASHSSLTPLGSRPQTQRRGISDPRYDRTRSRISLSYGSPARRARQRPQQTSRVQTSHTSETETPVLNEFGTMQTGTSQANAGAINANNTRTLNAITQAAISTPNQRTSFTPQHVHDELRNRITKDLNYNQSMGTVYIARDPNRPHLLKIGATDNFTNRRRTLEQRCRLSVELVHSSSRLVNYFRAEQLAQGDLIHLRRRYECNVCNTEHREWFEVSEELAKQTVERWVGFMKQYPYTRTGKLKAIWQYRLGQRTLPSSEVDHSRRWKHWSLILLPPSRLDHCLFWLEVVHNHPIWQFSWDFSWQISCVVSWLVTFLVLRNSYVFFILLSHIACGWVSMSSRFSKRVRGVAFELCAIFTSNNKWFVNHLCGSNKIYDGSKCREDSHLPMELKSSLFKFGVEETVSDEVCRGRKCMEQTLLVTKTECNSRSKWRKQADVSGTLVTDPALIGPKQPQPVPVFLLMLKCFAIHHTMSSSSAVLFRDSLYWWLVEHVQMRASDWVALRVLPDLLLIPILTAPAVSFEIGQGAQSCVVGLLLDPYAGFYGRSLYRAKYNRDTTSVQNTGQFLRDPSSFYQHYLTAPNYGLHSSNELYLFDIQTTTFTAMLKHLLAC
ncbi:uncharacterized protein BDR25DRAFT_349943 [Lindgomyces ingoldianus]|uniref:Uncharacterized protein n=1 Tax=Lindgomyces ingoldianus TaxID=673940 RepID=A0ACB6RA65_9PLEO|nr:uncharacterized protein BDR25DRAFT_349943 [Lindgomyces ingoldianus]KAF2475658.1 hypothetical protein BDR25DRAFT_349943 [Lindgomyces ingoldianus]